MTARTPIARFGRFPKLGKRTETEAGNRGDDRLLSHTQAPTDNTVRATPHTFTAAATPDAFGRLLKLLHVIHLRDLLRLNLIIIADPVKVNGKFRIYKINLLKSSR